MRPNLPLTLLSVSLCSSQAQVTPPDPGSQPVAPSSGGSSLPDPLTWPVTARDWNTVTRQFSESVTNVLTGEVTVEPHEVIQVGTGISYLDSSGAWQPSEDLIELTADGGAEAVHGPHKVYFSAAGLTDDAALTIVTLCNRVFQARVLGVYYFDPPSGQSMLLAAPSDQAVAELHPPNQIVYRSAFDSDLLKADLRYTYTKSGFESEVILTSQPRLSPSDCGFDPGTALLQVWHQWVGPTPEINPITLGAAAGPELTDQILDFGDLWLPSGRAFLTDGSTSTDTNVAAQILVARPGGSGADVPVTKQWQSAGATNMLTESVTWASIAPQLAALPLIASADSPSAGIELAAAPGQGLFFQTGIFAQGGIQFAGAPYDTPGLVLDYAAVTAAGQDYTFQTYVPGTGTTYLIDGSPAYFGGTVTFQPGCVIKYGGGQYLLVYGGVVCNGYPASPSMLTSKYDTQYGDILSSEHSPATGDAGTALWLYYINTNVTVSGLCVRYARTAIEFDANDNSLTETVADTVLYACQTGIDDEYNCPNVSIANSFWYQVTTPTTCPCEGNSFTGAFSQGSAPVFTVVPACQVVEQGTAVTLTAAISPPDPATYQWRLYVEGPPGEWSWQDIAGATGPSLTLPSPTDGTQVEVAGGNAFGTVLNPPTTVTISVLDTPAWTKWQDILAETSTRTPGLWVSVPVTNQPTGMAWNTNCLIYGKRGFTAISQLNSWDVGNNGPGIVPVTALTRRHGYTRGHGMGPTTTNLNPLALDMTVWFVTTNSPPTNLVAVNVLAYIVHAGDDGYEYTVLLFDSDLPRDGISPMEVGGETTNDTVILATSQTSYGGVPGSVAIRSPDLCGLDSPFFFPVVPGDSGSPLMRPTLDNALVFYTGLDSSGPCPQMQLDMDTLSASPPWSLDPAKYQMKWHHARRQH